MTSTGETDLLSRYASAVSAALVVAVVLALACSDDVGEESGVAALSHEEAEAFCSGVTPCGGELVGSWRSVQVTCPSAEPPAETETPCAPMSDEPAAPPKLDVSLIFSAPGTVRGSYSLFTAGAFTLSKECVASLGGGARAADACGVLQEPWSALPNLPVIDGVDASASYANARCTPNSAGGCNCEVDRAITIRFDGAAYGAEPDGSKLWLGDETLQLGPYCVDGDHLTVGDMMVGRMLLQRED